MKKTLAFVLCLVFAFATVSLATEKKLSAPTTGTTTSVVTDNVAKKADVKKTKKKAKKQTKKKVNVNDNTVKKIEKTPSNAI